MTILRGSTWAHDRGLAPMLATSARFTHLHPDVRIDWNARSLQQFADFPLPSLAAQYDLIVLDHPFIGAAASQEALAPLDQHLPGACLAALEAESVGLSHQSYSYDGHQWALAIDAAAQVAAFRPDLLDSGEVPATWDAVLHLARKRPGCVALPLLPVDALMSFFTLCANFGEPPSSGHVGMIGEQIGRCALEFLKELADLCRPECHCWNPIALWERMSSTDEIVYCPLGFGYSNYSRPKYRERVLCFTNIPSQTAGPPAGSTLGGAGLAISASCKDVSTALEYACWVAGADCQRSLYFESGGQPGNRRAWIDSEVNQRSNAFFDSTLPTLENAYLRPRHPGYIEFQKTTSGVISRFLRGVYKVKEALRLINDDFRCWRTDE